MRLSDKGLVQRPETDIEQRDDITSCTISTWVEMSVPPNGHRIQFEVEFTYDGLELAAEEMSGNDGTVAIRWRAIKLKGVRVLRAEIVGTEVRGSM